MATFVVARKLHIASRMPIAGSNCLTGRYQLFRLTLKWSITESNMQQLQKKLRSKLGRFSEKQI